MPSHRSARRAVLGALAALSFASAANALTVPTNFVVENAVPGVNFQNPTGFAFLPDGRFLVAEKAGNVWMVQNGVRLANMVWSRPAEILDNVDRGFLGIAVDPNYFVNHYVYFLYTVDPDSNGTDTNAYGFGRLTRYTMHTVGDTNTVDPASRTVLLGTDWRHGPLIASPSHTIGSLRWGTDGTLLVSVGDGASFDEMDPGGLQPQAFGTGRTDPFEDIGAFRAQDITILCGKILRLDPSNGHGYASNPYATTDLTATRSKVWAYGLRNPFRFAIRPGTGSTNPAAGNPGTLYVGDVGWDTWEELDVITAPGQNFGWPCIEGPAPRGDYQAATPAHNGCGSVGSSTNPAPWRAPAATWNHGDPDLSQPPGFAGNASVGGVFYADTLYPAVYRGRYFFADYAAAWIKVATFDANHNLVSIQPFGDTMDAPVDLAVDPAAGNVYYCSITTGEIRRIRYTGPGGGNAPPVAHATAFPMSGVAPLSVDFSSSGSFDPDGDPITFHWDFGDGQSSDLPNPTHVYLVAGAYVATLTVDDGRGGQGQDPVGITAGVTAAFPTTNVLDNFNRANGPLGANWVDPEYGMAGVQVIGNQLAHTCCYQAPVWNPTSFGADQEAFVTIATLAANEPGHDLMLKIQGNSWGNAHVEVRYDDIQKHVTVNTYDPPVGWVERGSPIPATFVSGDQLGARGRASGILEVFQNGVKLGEVSLGSWAYAAAGGRIGLTLDGTTGARLDDFGGGTWVPNSSPSVAVTSPNGGEGWVGGSSHAITWLASDDVGVTGVDLFYRENAGAPWTPLALNQTNSGSFTWFVHNTPGTQVRVRVVARDGVGNVGADSSDADFTITATPGGRVATTLRDFQQPGTQPLGAGAFQSHNTCFTCHGGYDPAVEPGRNFRGTLMAQAARDPLFYACLAIAEQDAPSSGDLCIRCHSPNAWLTGKSQPTSGAQIDALGRDGVACDFCHRLVDPIYQPGVSPPEDQAVINDLLPAHRPTTHSNGQYVVDPNIRRRGPFSDPATPHTFLQSPFHTKSELCATCHDVSNPVFERVAGADYAPGPLDAPAPLIAAHTLMPLERTYSEWANSAFPAGVFAPQFAGTLPSGIVSQCQDCHLRDVNGQGCSLDPPVRNNLPLHDMTGGNAWMGGVIASLYPTETDAAALADGAERAVSMLQKAATLDLTVAAAGDSFLASAMVTNQTGHKLPTGYPEGRRMWINLVARDDGGNVVFQSGAYDTTDGVLFHDVGIRVYEAALGLSPPFANAIGLREGPTFHFALNDTLYKDNRIPPAGFTNAAFEVFGGAPVDPDLPAPRYADGQNWDITTYGLPATARTVKATLYYQTTSREYVEFLRDENLTNTAGQALYDAWAAHGRSAPVAMAVDSADAVPPVDVPSAGVPRTLSLRALANPFRGRLQMALALPHPAEVRMDVIDVSGRTVRRLSNGRLPAGEHRLVWDGRNASGHEVGAGVYWASVWVDQRRLVRHVVRLR